MMQFRLYFLILTFLLSLSFGWSQNSYSADSVIISLLEEQNFFELEGAYEKMGEDLSPLWKLFCKAELAKAFGRRDEHSELLIEFLKTYDTNLKEEFKEQVYRMLFQNIIETGNESHYHWGCEKIRQYIENNPDSLSVSRLSMYKKNISLVKERYAQNLSYPPIKINREEPSEGIPLFQGVCPQIMAKLNNFSCPTIMDTGDYSYMTISSEKANEIGLTHCYKDTVIRNGDKVEIKRGLLDSIEIGALKLYNIPVEIEDFSSLYNLPDSLKFIKEIKEQNNLLEAPKIGLSLLRLIGSVEFDFNKNEVSFPEVKTKSIKHNLFINEDKLYTKVQIDGVSTILGIDTGSSDFMTLSNHFYKKNKRFLSTKEIDTSNEITVSINLHNIEVRKKRLILETPVIYFLDRRVDKENKEEVEIGAKTNFLTAICFPYYDGVLGYPFFKSMKNKTVLFDFRNMVITVQDAELDGGD